MDEENPKHRGPWWAHTAQRSRAVPWTWKSTVTVAVIGMIMVLGLGAVLAGVRPPAESPWVYSDETIGVAVRPSVDALAARCGPIMKMTGEPTGLQVGTVPNEDADGNPVSLGYIGTTVPIKGIMPITGVDTDTKRTWGVDEKDTAPTPETVLRSLYDGWMVAYYASYADPSKVRSLIDYAEKNPDMRMLVVPWPKTKDELPGRRELAFATWGGAQLCMDFLNRQIRTFRDELPASSAPGFTGQQPPTIPCGKDFPVPGLCDPTPSPTEPTAGDPPQDPGATASPPTVSPQEG